MTQKKKKTARSKEKGVRSKAPAAPIVNCKSSIVNRKVWRIFNWGERFETDACRKGPLQFCKYPVVGQNDNESHILMEQMARLSQFDDVTLLLEGAFWRLVKQAGRRSCQYRGYLLNEKYEPMTNPQIALLLGIDRKRATEVLKKLAKVNLIEQVDMPDFDAMKPPPPDDPAADPPDGDGPGRPAGAKKKTAKTSPRSSRSTTEKKEKKKKTTKKKTTAKGAVNETELEVGGSGRKGRPAGSTAHGEVPSDDGQKFAKAVYEKVYGKPVVDTKELRSEVVALGNCWDRAVATGLPTATLDELWDESMQEAFKQGNNHRKGIGENNMAIFTSVFNKRLAARVKAA